MSRNSRSVLTPSFMPSTSESLAFFSSFLLLRLLKAERSVNSLRFIPLLLKPALKVCRLLGDDSLKGSCPSVPEPRQRLESALSDDDTATEELAAANYLCPVRCTRPETRSAQHQQPHGQLVHQRLTSGSTHLCNTCDHGPVSRHRFMVWCCGTGKERVGVGVGGGRGVTGGRGGGGVGLCLVVVWEWPARSMWFCSSHSRSYRISIIKMWTTQQRARMAPLVLNSPTGKGRDLINWWPC